MNVIPDTEAISLYYDTVFNKFFCDVNKKKCDPLKFYFGATPSVSFVAGCLYVTFETKFDFQVYSAQQILEVNFLVGFSEFIVIVF